MLLLAFSKNLMDLFSVLCFGLEFRMFGLGSLELVFDIFKPLYLVLYSSEACWKKGHLKGWNKKMCCVDIDARDDTYDAIHL